MRAKVLLLRRNGVLIGHPVTRDLSSLSAHLLDGLLEMPRGGPMGLRSGMSHPGKEPMIELHAPTMLAVANYWLHARGFEKAVVNELEAGVLQEWIVMIRGPS